MACFLTASSRGVARRTAVVCCWLLLLAGCVGVDFVELAQDSLRKAFRYETPGAFFQPVLERARGDRESAHMHVRAREHYLQIIASIERLTPAMRDELHAKGMLGEALALKALAQWRMERLDAARMTLALARATNQEPLRARDRALLEGMAGVLELERALLGEAERRPFAEIYAAAAGESGAWRLLAVARTKVAADDRLQPDLMQARLGSYATVVAAFRRDPAGAEALDPETLPRLRAEAQVELNQLARTATVATPSFAAVLRRWQQVCGLDTPPPP